jgi:hypothetical protein
MRFELEPDNFGQPNEVLLADLRRVSDALKPRAVTKDLYNEHGRWCAATMRKRFGNWNTALSLAGFQPSKRVNIPSEELLGDLRSVAAVLGRTTLTRQEYDAHGRFSPAPLERRFGTWNKAMRMAGLEPVFRPAKVTNERCFEAIDAIWRKVGRPPCQDELRRPEVSMTGRAIAIKLGSWRKALEAFVSYVNGPAEIQPDQNPRSSGARQPISDAIPRTNQVATNATVAVLACVSVSRSCGATSSVASFAEHLRPHVRGPNSS